VMVIRQHDGQTMPQENERVMVGWRPEDMRVMAAQAGAS
jgi:putative spermidine/putrescine transport system ATP-binding protein